MSSRQGRVQIDEVVAMKSTARLATHPPFAGVLDRDRAVSGGNCDLRAVGFRGIPHRLDDER